MKSLNVIKIFAVKIVLVLGLILASGCKTVPKTGPVTLVNGDGGVSSYTVTFGEENLVTPSGSNMSIWELNGNNLFHMIASTRSGQVLRFSPNEGTKYVIFDLGNSPLYDAILPVRLWGNIRHYSLGLYNEPGATVPSNSSELWGNIIAEFRVGCQAGNIILGSISFPGGNDFTVGFGSRNVHKTEVYAVYNANDMDATRMIMREELAEKLSRTDDNFRTLSATDVVKIMRFILAMTQLPTE